MFCLLLSRRPWGLSPRVRGSHVLPSPVASPLGSIPASAGQPLLRALPGRTDQVYPRECGAALLVCDTDGIFAGLSPRVRGSPYLNSPEGYCSGSIPASAGQPLPQLTRRILLWVYPRECGAAGDTEKQEMPPQGLSPRVRGSRKAATVNPLPSRSIPASAGQPMLTMPTIQVTTVYPRECGAAFQNLAGSQLVTGLSPRVRGSRKHYAHTRYRAGSIPASARASLYTPTGRPTTRRSIPASAGQPLGELI